MQSISQLKGDNSNKLLTGKSAALKNAADLTGLNSNYLQLLYESENLDSLVNLIGFDGKFNNSELSNKFSLTKEISNILDSDNLEQTKIDELIRLTEYASKLNNLDSIDVLTGISDLLLINDKKSKDYIIGLNKLRTVELDKLNESKFFNILNFDSNPEKSKELFESIEILLTKQNKRWGNAYRLTNTYNAIMEYLKLQYEQLILTQEIITSNTNFHLEIIKDFVNQGYNPLYRDINSIKSLCPDIQTLNFDMILLVNQFINQNLEALEFIHTTKVLEYNIAGNNLLQNTISSINTSRILCDNIVRDLNNVYANNNDNLNTPLLTLLTNNIDFESLVSFNLKNIISTKAAHDMVLLINSSSVEFNLKLRPMIKVYVTKALELIKRVDDANFKLNKFRK